MSDNINVGAGGYDYEVIGDCVVCLNLMKDAMQLDNCDHGYVILFAFSLANHVLVHII